jgi:hypothetical protein
MAKKPANRRRRSTQSTEGPRTRSPRRPPGIKGPTKSRNAASQAIPRSQRNESGKKNQIHLSLFVDGQEVTLIDEFDTPGEAMAAAREFLDKHHPAPVKD